MTEPTVESDVRLSVGDRIRLRWWKVRDWLHRCPECGVRGYYADAPRWEDDVVAQTLGTAGDGCPCCGKGGDDA